VHRSMLGRTATLAAIALATACGGTPDASFDASAPEVPYTDQYNPAGKDAHYDGTENCGPALLASIAKARHQNGGLSDAALINELAAIAGTDAEGTSGYGMIAGLESLGMQVEANAGVDLHWINNELASGHDVIANGDFYAVPGRENPRRHAGHYIAITAVGNGWSKYRVTDPASQAVTSMTAAQVRAFVSSHPQGGFTLAAW
jgi:hypothetical protein